MCPQNIAKEHHTNSDRGEAVSLVSRPVHSTVSTCYGKLALACYDSNINKGLSSTSPLFSLGPPPFEPFDRSISVYRLQTRSLEGPYHLGWGERLFPGQANDLVYVEFHQHPVPMRFLLSSQGFHGITVEDPESASIQGLRDVRGVRRELEDHQIVGHGKLDDGGSNVTQTHREG